MKQYNFTQEGHGVSYYTCCYTSFNFQHARQQEIIKKHLTLLGAHNIK